MTVREWPAGTLNATGPPVRPESSVPETQAQRATKEELEAHARYMERRRKQREHKKRR